MQGRQCWILNVSSPSSLLKAGCGLGAPSARNTSFGLFWGDVRMETPIDNSPGRKSSVCPYSPAARHPSALSPGVICTRGSGCQHCPSWSLKSVASVRSDPSPWSQALTGRPLLNLGGSAGPAPCSGTKGRCLRTLRLQPRQAHRHPRGRATWL